MHTGIPPPRVHTCTKLILLCRVHACLYANFIYVYISIFERVPDRSFSTLFENKNSKLKLRDGKKEVWKRESWGIIHTLALKDKNMSSVQIRCDRNVNGREIDEGRREEEIFLDINSSSLVSIVKIVLHRIVHLCGVGVWCVCESLSSDDTGRHEPITRCTLYTTNAVVLEPELLCSRAMKIKVLIGHLTCMFHNCTYGTWMLSCHRCDIIHFVSNNKPTVILLIMSSNLFYSVMSRAPVLG